MELNTINKQVSWGVAADALNKNFEKVGTDLEKLKNVTTRNKGYFSSETALNETFPTANVGDIAYVAVESGGYNIWSWDGSAWVDTGVAGGDAEVDLGDYYNKTEIDNIVLTPSNEAAEMAALSAQHAESAAASAESAEAAAKSAESKVSSAEAAASASADSAEEAHQSSELAKETVLKNRYGYNVTVYGLVGGTHNIDSAINDVPAKFRMLGQKITFRAESGDWQTWQNKSLSMDGYTQTDNWIQEIGTNSVTGDINITNNPDYEDLTEDGNGNMKLADKEYNSDTFSGLGRKHLRKNIVTVTNEAGESLTINQLTQDMLSWGSTRYIIQYDFDLNGAEITVPEGCILDFQGGSISNGIIKGTNTLIKSLEKTIFRGITVSGTFSNNVSHTIWFTSASDGSADALLNNALNLLSNGGTLYVDKGIYNIKFRWTIKNRNNINVINKGIIQPMADIVPPIGTIDIGNVHNSCFYNLEINGNVKNIPETTDFGTQSLMRISECSNLVFDNISIYDTNESAISGNGLSNCLFNNIKFENIGEHGVYIGGVIPSKNIYFKNVKAKNIGLSSPNKNRGCAVIKFRMFEVGLLHENIVVDGFDYEDDAVYTSDNFSKYNLFAQLIDTKSSIVSNGSIKNTNTEGSACIAVIQTNAVSTVKVDNVNAHACREFILYGFNYGDNNTTAIPVEDYLYHNVQFYNCKLVGFSNNFTAADYHNCNIILTSYISDVYMKAETVSICYFIGCSIDFGTTKRMDNYKCKTLVFDKCTLKSGMDYKIINRYPDAVYKLIDTVEIYNGEGTAGNLIRNHEDSTYSIYYTRCSINSPFKSAKYVSIIDMEYPFTTASTINGYYHGLTRNGVSIDRGYKEVTMWSENVTADFRFTMAKKLEASDIIVIAPYLSRGYTFTVNNNIVTINLSGESDGSGYLFRIWAF